MSGVREFLAGLFARLEEASVPYCVLRNWETLPDAVGNDVDLWVGGEHGSAFEDLLLDTARRLGWSLALRVPRLGYRGDGHYVFAAGATGECLVIDAYRFLVWRGLRYADEGALRHARSRHERGFFVPPPGFAAASLVLKEVLFQGELRERYRASMADGAVEEGGPLHQSLSAFVGRDLAGRILDRIARGDWSGLSALRRRLQITLFVRSLARNPILTPWLMARHVYRRVMARIRPPGGFFLVLIGSDGAGKTTTANALLHSPLIQQLFSSGSYVYRRFPMFPELKRLLPHSFVRGMKLSPDLDAGARMDGLPPAGTARCILYVLYYGMEYFLGRAWLWKVARLGNRIIVFDRYWHEFIFQRRYQKCPRILLRMLERAAAQPDALVFLDVPPEVAYERRQEQPLAEIQRFHRLGAEVVERSRDGYSLPVTTVEASVRKLEEIVVERMAARARRGLPEARR